MERADTYNYMTLRLWGVLSGVFAVVLLLTGGGGAVAVLFLDDVVPYPPIARVGMAYGILLAAFLISAALAIVNDVVRWMHDLANLSDRQALYLERLQAARPATASTATEAG